MTTSNLRQLYTNHVIVPHTFSHLPSFTVDQLHTFHAIDREIFYRLVIVLKRNPTRSLLVMATWLWLEEYGFPSIIDRMVGYPDLLVNALANEISLCLEGLESDDFIDIPRNGGMPLTTRVCGRNISLHLFQINRFTATIGIKNLLHDVCAKIFVDILRLALTGSSQENPNFPLILPGFPHRLFGHHISVGTHSVNPNFPSEGLWTWNRSYNACPDDRTLFLTFSRGFPVSEDEVKELFTTLYGDCIEDIHMQDNCYFDEQPLFARLVLHSVVLVDRILFGEKLKRFRINGKHVWSRKYEHRDDVNKKPEK